jgi:4-oxalomesaconate tautomerase
MVLLSPPAHGGTVSTRSFIPVRVHTSIGVLGALTVAAGIRQKGAVGHDIADLPDDPGAPMRIEHPTGHFDVTPTAVLRTARKLLDGVVYPREY